MDSGGETEAVIMIYARCAGDLAYKKVRRDGETGGDTKRASVNATGQSEMLCRRREREEE